ncbi:hypothetical protein BBJ28_00013808 [Nothophytophthora sp. Chile5]|nr:hypothetical protein BBJ28_00013808 [Nothophytophthora sp. Chile5]
MEEARDAATAKLLIATLQKYGYDLDDARSSSSTSSSSGSLSGDEAEEARGSGALRQSRGASAAGILALRERKNQQSALHIAAKKGHLDVLRALGRLPRVQDHLDAGDRHANTALHFAASSAKPEAPELVAFLLGLGASPRAVNVRGQTPLAIHIMTARTDDAAITKLLVAKLATSSASSDSGLAAPSLNELGNGTTYLHMAVERQLSAIAGALVQGGASINVPDQNGVMVSDVVAKKLLVKLVCVMTEGSQAAPPDIVRGRCKICRQPKGLLDPLRDCALCGRAVCKNCSQKASDIRSATSEGGHAAVPLKDKDAGKFCTVCCTVKLLRSKQHRDREGFNKKLMGCGMK